MTLEKEIKQEQCNCKKIDELFYKDLYEIKKKSLETLEANFEKKYHALKHEFEQYKYAHPENKLLLQMIMQAQREIANEQHVANVLKIDVETWKNECEMYKQRCKVAQESLNDFCQKYDYCFDALCETCTDLVKEKTNSGFTGTLKSKLEASLLVPSKN